ncbi:GNAT family N-acetyltransferase [Streptomyces lanatus]|uniref:GNAT family N-acetyltransferase n=1 Tax=Streptomyces lanatus TaxID=66900 RepID=A0ABV1Y7V0_9ACTN|nr:GNAT family N-acetyltransferase [Streptomyces lanatus]GHH31148.1 N-acetyltransferase [Streptomyces lanatus]
MAEVLFDDSARRVQVVDDPEARQYVLYVDGTQAGTLSYRIVGERRVLGHTEVDETYRGRGFAQILIQVVLDDLRERQQKATVYCPAVDRFIKQHVKYADVIDPSHPGIWFASEAGSPTA